MREKLETLLGYVVFGAFSIVFSMVFLVTGKRFERQISEVANENKSNEGTIKGMGQPGCVCRVRDNSDHDNSV